MQDKVSKQLVCLPKRLTQAQLLEAARHAIEINPMNRPPVERMAALGKGFAPTPQRIAVLTTAYWGTSGVKLTVGFLDTAVPALKTRILGHMNAWNKNANVNFTLTNDSDNADVRIAFAGGQDGGYWSYVGTQIKTIAKGQPTMNLEGFTMQTEDSEFYRVVRHETGHTLGFVHEHMRNELVKLIDKKKATAYFLKYDGWSAQETTAQVLTPIENATIKGTTADPKSIMCYQIPGELTKNGKPIIGGLDIDASDYAFCATIYPKGASAPKKKAAAKNKTTKKK
jgi:hypothetical protein